MENSCQLLILLNTTAQQAVRQLLESEKANMNICQALCERINPVEPIPKCNRLIARRYLSPSPGMVRTVERVDYLADHPDIWYLEIPAKPSGAVTPVDNAPARADVVRETKETTKSAISITEDVIDRVKIVVEKIPIIF